MDYAYSYNSYDGKKEPDAFFMQMAELSVVSLRNAIKRDEKITLYCDVHTAQIFQQIRHLFDEVVIVRWAFNNPAFWNTCKIETYACQDKPFLHVDFDTAFFDGFSVPDADIVTEMTRDYNTEDELLRRFAIDRYPQPDRLICSGLIGGRATDAFKHQFSHLASVESSLHDDTASIQELISLEEYTISQIAVVDKLEVVELDPRYFAHWQGSNKQMYKGIIDDLCEMFNVKTSRKWKELQS